MDYFSKLRQGTLYRPHVDKLLAEMESRLTLEEVPGELLRSATNQTQIPKNLSRLELRIARGPRGWNGLVIGFPGSTEELTTKMIGTPELRKILYPMADLRRRISDRYAIELPCVYLLGVSFPDVILKKLRLLDLIIPHIVVLTHDLPDRSEPRPPAGRPGEQGVQERLCYDMKDQDGLRVPVEGGHIRLDYVTHELPTNEATYGREQLDILGLDKQDKSLVAFEIKGPRCGRVELENLFFQGLAHRRWLELNIRALKFIFDQPGGRRIDMRKRVRLILGLFEPRVPDLFWELRAQAMGRDRYLKVDFVRLAEPGGSDAPLALSRINKEAE